MIDNTIQRTCQNDSGFSLLEMLVSLAILSLTSLALFQSMGSMLEVSEKASLVSIDVAEETIARTSFSQIVAGLTAGWREQTDTKFRGTTSYFTGLTSSVPTDADNQLSVFVVLLEQEEESTENILKLQTYDRTVPLKTLQGINPEFRYLGEDQTWYEKWPPEKIPVSVPQRDVAYLEMPNLPVAIRMIVEAPEGGDFVHKQTWTAFIESNPELPVRLEGRFAR